MVLPYVVLAIAHYIFQELKCGFSCGSQAILTLARVLVLPA